MKNLFTFAFCTLTLIATVSKAQFKIGQNFIGGGFSNNLYEFKADNKYAQNFIYNHGIDLYWGYFKEENKAVGWNISQGISINKLNDFDINPRPLRALSVGAERFVEYYKPISEKLALYLRPSLGLTYQLENTWGQDNPNPGIAYQTQTNTLILGASLAAGIAWRITPKWALYGNFAFTNPVSVSGGISTTENYQEKNPQGENVKTRGTLFEYNFSPSLLSGSISLGFRYFYTRKNSDS